MARETFSLENHLLAKLRKYLFLIALLTASVATSVGCSCSSQSENEENDGNIENEVAAPTDETTVDSTTSAVPDAALTTISLVGNIVADGLTAYDVQITVSNASGNGISGVTPEFEVTGNGNVVTQNCSASDENGISTCTGAVVFHVFEEKSYRVTSPVETVPNTFTPSLVERGYTKKACGFDMDGDGIKGEPEDCNVCDGVTTNVDDDPADEDLIYVDADYTGTENGTPSEPYNTVAEALAAANGPSTGEEDIICIRGSFSEQLSLTVSGKAEFDTIGGFQYPRNPTMIVGWDYDNDGVYPPADPDDLAEFDAAGSLTGPFDNRVGQVSYLEIAHLTVRNYDDGSEGFFFNGSAGSTSHIYVHDVETYDVQKGRSTGGPYEMFDLNGVTGLDYLAIENTLFHDFGGMFMQYNQSDADAFSNVRIKNSYLRMSSLDGIVSHFMQGRGSNSLHILNNVFDKDPDFAPSSFNALAPRSCSRDLVIRGNIFQTGRVAVQLVMADDSGTITPAYLSDMVFDGNLILTDDQRSGVLIQGSGTEGLNLADQQEYTVGAVTITNNIIRPKTTGAVNICIRLYAGNDEGADPSVITVAGNICESANVGVHVGAGGLTNKPALNFYNNIFLNNQSGGVDPGHFDYDYTPTSINADGNVYDNGTGLFNIGGSKAIDLSAWQAALSVDASSFVCTPEFIDYANLDYRLSSNDSCARNAGVDISAYTTVDYSGATRNLTAPDIGAFTAE